MKVFDIQIPTDTVSARGGEQTGVTFTVTNRSSGALRGLVHLQPRGSCQRQWLSTVGSSTIDFDEGASHQVEVEVSPPPDAEPGTYKFSLIVASEENPDEDYVEGVVQFDVTEPQQPPQKSPRWPLFVAIAVGVLVLIGLGVVLAKVLGGGPDEPESGSRAEVVQLAQDRLVEAKRELNTLERQAREAGTEVRRMWESSLRPRVQQQFEILARQADALKDLEQTGSEERWEAARAEFEEADQSLRRIFQAARQRLGRTPGDGDSRKFALVLQSTGRNKIEVIKAVREITGLGLRESKSLVDDAPSTVSKSMTKERAEEAAALLERAGARANIVPHEN